MVRLALPRNTVLLAAACLVVGCAGAPSLSRSVTIAPGQRTLVSLVQTQDGLRFELQNASATDRAAVYSDGRTNPLAKVVPDAQLQALLDVYSEKGMFESARAAVPGDARDVLLVEQGEQRWAWARRRVGLQADEAAFHEAKGYFLELYNSNTAYHGDSSGERPDFKAEKGRVREDGEAAKQKLEALQRKQR